MKGRKRKKEKRGKENRLFFQRVARNIGIKQEIMKASKNNMNIFFTAVNFFVTKIQYLIS